MSAVWKEQEHLSRRINSSIAIIDKRRPSPGKSEVMNIVGNIKNKNCVIVDDIIDSGGTIVNAAKVLKGKRSERRLCLYYSCRIKWRGQ